MDLPFKTGYQQSTRPTLCIGLDIAWFGGSASNKYSQFDFIASTLISNNASDTRFRHQRVQLIDRDPKAQLLCEAIKRLLQSYEGDYEQAVFAVDAPLQASKREHLPNRQSLAVKGAVERRSCEKTFSSSRMAIDKALGGAQGWQPNVQPGAPIAPRIEAMIKGLEGEFELWTPHTTNKRNLMVECFPAEAIWAAKRQGWFTSEISSGQAKSYKKQKGKLLTELEVAGLVKSVLSPFGKVCDECLWDTLVDRLLTDILQDEQWKKEGFYQGGKMLDDVVDTMLCLSTAIGYSIGNAHAWFDANKPDDGHIIGPGSFQSIKTVQSLFT